MLKPPRIDCSNAPAAQQVLNSLVVDATLVNQKDQRKDKKNVAIEFDLSQLNLVATNHIIKHNSPKQYIFNFLNEIKIFSKL